jgi:hypothetical protein
MYDVLAANTTIYNSRMKSNKSITSFTFYKRTAAAVEATTITADAKVDVALAWVCVATATPAIGGVTGVMTKVTGVGAVDTGDATGCVCAA